MRLFLQLSGADTTSTGKPEASRMRPGTFTRPLPLYIRGGNL
jgi:hypothetical protein